MKKFLLTILLATGLCFTSQAVSYRGFVEAFWGVKNSISYQGNSLIAYNNYPSLTMSSASSMFDTSFSGVMNVSLYTTHGAQIFRMLYVGVGASLDFVPADDSPIFDNVGVYADVRWDGFGLPGISKVVTPFVDLKLGCNINTYKYQIPYSVPSYFFDEWHTSQYGNLCDHLRNPATGFMLRPAIGMRIRLSPRIGLNISLAYLLRPANEYKLQSVNTVVFEDPTGQWDYKEEAYILKYGEKSYKAFGSQSLQLGIGVDF